MWTLRCSLRIQRVEITVELEHAGYSVHRKKAVIRAEKSSVLTHKNTHTHTLRLRGSVGKVIANYLRDQASILVFRYFLVRLQALPAVRIRISSSRL